MKFHHFLGSHKSDLFKTIYSSKCYGLWPPSACKPSETGDGEVWHKQRAELSSKMWSKRRKGNKAAVGKSYKNISIGTKKHHEREINIQLRYKLVHQPWWPKQKLMCYLNSFNICFVRTKKIKLKNIKKFKYPMQFLNVHFFPSLNFQRLLPWWKMMTEPFRTSQQKKNKIHL